MGVVPVHLRSSSRCVSIGARAADEALQPQRQLCSGNFVPVNVAGVGCRQLPYTRNQVSVSASDTSQSHVLLA